MSDEQKTKIKDESNDRMYFTVTPRLVWALCEDPDEYTLWCVIKDIAGDHGECIMARDDLATLAMMSGGRVSKCRESLIRKHLLNGEFKRDPGYPQAVWHLTVPDFWEANTRWARKYPKIADRISFKKQQADALKDAKKEPSQDDALKEPSQDDRGVSPDDGGLSPDDGKKNVLKNQKEESKDFIWESILSALSSTVNRNTMTFIRAARPVSFENDILILSAIDDTARDWLKGNARKTIENTFPGIIQRAAKVEIITAEAGA